MFFKKKKISPSTGTPKKTVYLLGLIGSVGVCILGIFVISTIGPTSFNIFEFANSSGSTTKNSGITLGTSRIIFGNTDTQEGGIKNDLSYILITGRGGGDHDAPNLTDTLILAGINSKKETITLFSIPRDLYIRYPESSKTGKINKIYETYAPESSELGIQKLKTKISEITGKDIDYYINLDFEGFREVVDAIGGVEITLEENFVDYEFPDGNLGYRPFILKKGTWTLDGDVALMYARSRHSTSDFDRSLRQQQIISSLREKIGNLGYLKDAKKIYELYTIFGEYVETDMSVTDMVSIGREITGWSDTNTLSFNLNDSCYQGSIGCDTGGFLYVPLREYFGGASVLLPNDAIAAKPSQYEIIHTFTNLIFDNSEIYSDPKNIVIYNSTGIAGYAGQLENILRPFGFPIDKNTGTQTLSEKKFEKSILYYNGIDEDDSTLIALINYIDMDIERVESPVYSSEDIRIEIVLADTDSF